MKFNPELMRAILIDTEGIPAGDHADTYTYDDRDWTEAEINRHVQILIDEGFIEGKYVRGNQGFAEFFHATDLTYRGHQFLANARNENLWNRALSFIKDKGVSMTVSAIEAALTQISLRAIGIDNP